MEISKHFQDCVEGAMFYGAGSPVTEHYLEQADEMTDEADEPERTALVAYARLRFLGVDDITARKALSQCGKDAIELDGLERQLRTLTRKE